jgi:hypothetical protein
MSGGNKKRKQEFHNKPSAVEGEGKAIKKKFFEDTEATTT